jgi:hypothetical protein
MDSTSKHLRELSRNMPPVGGDKVVESKHPERNDYLKLLEYLLEASKPAPDMTKKYVSTEMKAGLKEVLIGTQQEITKLLQAEIVTENDPVSQLITVFNSILYARVELGENNNKKTKDQLELAMFMSKTFPTLTISGCVPLLDGWNNKLNDVE